MEKTLEEYMEELKQHDYDIRNIPEEVLLKYPEIISEAIKSNNCQKKQS